MPSDSTSSSGAPWFAVSIGLMGLIAGYAIGVFIQPSLVGSAPTAAVVQNPEQPEVPEAPAGVPPTPGIGPVVGKADAPVTIVEFTDFECPFCSRHFTDTYGQIKSAYVDTGKVKYEIRNLPLSSLHPNAQLAAEAALCAHKQGKFWEMHDALFTNQDAWSQEPDPTKTFEQYGTTVGANASAFSTCLTNHETLAQVQKDAADGSLAGVSGTPGFWILGPGGKTQMISGAYPFATFQAAIDGML